MENYETDNKIIASFVGEVVRRDCSTVYKIDNELFEPEQLKFHSDWEWLIKGWSKFIITMVIEKHSNNNSIVDAQKLFHYYVDTNAKKYAFDTLATIINWYNEIIAKKKKS